MTSPPITRVTGGVAGISATYAAVRALADRFDRAGDRMREWAATGARTLADPDLVVSAALSPLTFAEAEEKVLAATTGPHGVLPASLLYEGDALAVRTAVAALEECDRMVGAAVQALDYDVGRCVGVGVVAAAPDTIALGALARLAWPHLPEPVRSEGETQARLAGTVVAAEVVEHPGVAEHAVDCSGGLLDGLLSGPALLPGLALGLAPFHPTTRAAAADLAGLYDAESPPRVRRRDDLWVPLGAVPPRDLRGLVDHLAETNDLSPVDRPGDQGTMEVQRLRSADGSVRFIVYLPGTDDLTTTPTGQDSDVRDLATNLHLTGGQDTSYAEGIHAAMHRAGIGPDDPVLLAGHSQGGMEAAALLHRGSGFRVTHVVTAGSPLSQVHGFPSDSHVLSLENRGDVVPLLDGADNADTRQQVTVQFDDREASIPGNHDLRHYTRGAEVAEASTDPSIREQLASLRRHGFLGTHAVATSQIFQITRCTR